MATRVRFLSVLASAFLCFTHPAMADEGLANFRHADAEEDATAAKPAAREVTTDFGRVPTDKVSLVNLAPGLLAFFNNGPTFGIPGTVTGDIWSRTQLTGDWGGLRTDLARKGLFFDLYTTSTYQNVSSGGLKTGASFVQNAHLTFNLDTGRAGLWSGGLFHLALQSRYGAKPGDSITGGGAVPQYVGLVEPGPTLSHHTLPSEYFFAQALGQKFSVVAGKISDIYIPDQTAFASSYKYHFANFNFNKNPMTVNFYNPTAWAGLLVWTPAKWLALAGGVLDPNSQSNNFAARAFDKVNLYLMAITSYDIAGLPGQFSPAFNWSNKPKLDLTAPFDGLTRAMAPRAVESLLGAAEPLGLPANYKKESWFAIANFSQYLYLREAPEDVPAKMKSGQLLRGVGVMGRVGYAPDETNRITRDGSIALFNHGLFDARPYDSFGAGLYYNGFSGHLKNDLFTLTGGTAKVKNETGTEVFYDFAITPAVRLITSYQHIWNPIDAKVARNVDHADIFMTRLNITW